MKKAMKKAVDWGKVGELGREETDEPSDSPFMKKLILAFQDYPVKWTNSSDLLYSMPKEKDGFSFFKEEEKQGRKPQRRSSPWEYQEGRIFKAYLIKQSGKAFLLRFNSGAAWVPKGQVDFESREVWLPEWLMKDKGLGEKDAEERVGFEWEPELVKKGKVIKPRRKEMKRK